MKHDLIWLVCCGGWAVSAALFALGGQPVLAVVMGALAAWSFGMWISAWRR